MHWDAMWLLVFAFFWLLPIPLGLALLLNYAFPRLRMRWCCILIFGAFWLSAATLSLGFFVFP